MPAALAVTLISGAPQAAAGQIKASEPATLTQTIDGTTLTIEYSRPSLRGRDPWADLFGEQIPFGRAWTPGANRATTLESDKAFTLAGATVPAGRYSVWMVPGEEEWTFVLDPRDGLFHTAYPEPTDEQIRFAISAARAPYSIETLAWTFPAVRNDGADLRMQWGDVAVEVVVEVEPTVRLTLTADEAAPYVGAYQVEQMPSNFGGAHSFELELELVDGHLTGEMAFGPDFSMDVAFVMAADQVFNVATMLNGEAAEVFADMLFEFVLEDDRAVSFELRGEDDELIMRGTRAP